MLISTNYDADPNATKNNAQNDYTMAETRESLLRVLMCHVKNGESEDFSKVAIASLVKKLWSRGVELDNLMMAIESRGATATKCVTVQRSLDGRLQVAGRKFFPHVLYAKIWRWPNVLKNEMKHIRGCEYAFDLKSNYVCVNPYHYERYENSDSNPSFPDIPSLMLQPKLENVYAESSSTDDDTSGSASVAASSENSYGLGASPSYIDINVMQQIYLPDKSPLPAATYPQQDVDVLDEDWRCLQPEDRGRDPTSMWEPVGPDDGVEPRQNFASVNDSQRNFINVNGHFESSDMRAVGSGFRDLGLHYLNPEAAVGVNGVRGNVIDETGLMQGPSMEHLYGQTTDHGNTIDSMNPNDFNVAHESSQNLYVDQFGCHLQESTMNQLYDQTGNPRNVIESMSHNDLEKLREGSDGSSIIGLCPNGLVVNAVSQSYDNVVSSQWTEPNGLMHIENVSSNEFENPAYRVDHNDINEKFERLSTLSTNLEHWCSIDYFELQNRVGETFKVKRGCPTVTIDGYVNPSDKQRFCLGALSNVHRTESSEKVRLHIGKGVTLETRDNGDVWLSCNSENSVFLRSHYLDVASGLSIGGYVHKIHPSVCVKVFDLRQCYAQMWEHAAVARKMAAVAVEQANADPSVTENLDATTGIGVDDLRRYCIFSLSFIKGWGHDYPRPDIKDTPCWIEVHLHRALQLLDDILHST